MNSPKILRVAFVAFLSVLLYSQAFSQNSVSLRRSFIDSLKNSISIKTNFIVDKAHSKPNTGAKDGDLHISGRSVQIGLPTVAEIMNAKEFSETVDLVHAVEGTDDALDITGVWRLWFEHPNGSQVQKVISKKFTSTNPDHIFEIHPLLKLNQEDLISSLTTIPGFKPKDAAKAFNSYLHTVCMISVQDNMVTIDSKKVGYNYVEFKLEIISKKNVSDGVFAMADVKTKRGRKIAENIRMVFPKDSGAEIELRALNKGDEMHVLGIPRVNLDEIIKQLQSTSEIEISLPFEMIIVGSYN